MPLIDGKHEAERILNKLRPAIQKLARRGHTPRLAIALVGSNPASELYVRKKQETAATIGIDCTLYRFPERISARRLTDELKKLQKDPKLSGLIVQLPLPPHLDQTVLLAAIKPEVDVDCLTAENIGQLFGKHPRFIPPTTQAVLHVIREHSPILTGKKICLIGAGFLVGKPVSTLLMHHDITLTICTKATTDLARYCKEADIIISGAGKPGLISARMVKRGALLIDVGIGFKDNQVVGDSDTERISAKAFVTPTPGGIGPLTVAYLLHNVVLNAASTTKVRGARKK